MFLALRLGIRPIGLLLTEPFRFSSRELVKSFLCLYVISLNAVCLKTKISILNSSHSFRFIKIFKFHFQWTRTVALLTLSDGRF